MGILATTRAIGDHDLRPYGVVATPDVLELPRAAEQEFLALGSDGLWDVLNNQVGLRTWVLYMYVCKGLHEADGSVIVLGVVGQVAAGACSKEACSSNAPDLMLMAC